ncbi:MAG: glycosyltransferase family 39 protein [Verrucomicrobia bacterium]|nr:glycosyltransferase family 39 protein [Verrucomicrobiota bacterium]
MGVFKLGALLTVVGALWLLFCVHRLFCGLNHPEAMDQAQLARNLARGDGCTTRFIRPLSVWLVAQHAAGGDLMLGRHPDLMNPPLYPGVVAGLFQVLQKGDVRPMMAGKDGPGAGFRCAVAAARVLSSRVCLWLWVALAVVWFLVAWIRYIFDRLRPGEIGLHATGTVACLLLAGLAYAPKLSFGVLSVEMFKGYAPDLWIVCGLGVPLTVLNGWLVYLIGRRLFDRRAGALAACLFVLSDTVCQYTLSGLSMTLAMTWTLVAWLALLVADPWQERGQRRGGSVALALAAAALLGLAFLTKYAAGWLLLPACLLAWRGRGAARGALLAAAMVAVFAAVTAPWLVRNHGLSGSVLGLAKYALLEQTGVCPGQMLERTLQLGEVALSWKSLAAKAARTGHELWASGGWISGAMVPWALFFAVIFYRFRSARANAWKWFAAGAAALLFGVTCIVGLEPRLQESPALSGNLVVLMLPLAAVLGAAVLWVWVDTLNLRHPMLQKVVVASLVIAAAFPLLLRVTGAPAGRMAYPPYHPPVLRQVANCLNPDEFMVSDLPWAVAWYGDRSCLWLPWTPEQFYQITDRHQHIAAMLLTPLTLNARFLTEISGTEWSAWAPILGYLQFPADFPLRAGMVFVGPGLSLVEWDLQQTLDIGKVGGGVQMVLACDKKRWRTQQHDAPARQ